MKGVVFTEFIDMVEARYSLRIVDLMISQSDIRSGGAYTSVGVYDHRELKSLLTRLSVLVETPVEQLCREFGRHLFARLAAMYPTLVARYSNCFELLADLDQTIHAHVMLRIPDAQRLKIRYDHPSPDTMRIFYASPRGFAALAHGLLQGCTDHFGESLQIARLDTADETQACFLLSKP